jgi:hypothetical protein
MFFKTAHFLQRYESQLKNGESFILDTQKNDYQVVAVCIK